MVPSGAAYRLSGRLTASIVTWGPKSRFGLHRSPWRRLRQDLRPDNLVYVVITRTFPAYTNRQPELTMYFRHSVGGELVENRADGVPEGVSRSGRGFPPPDPITPSSSGMHRQIPTSFAMAPSETRI